MRFNEKEYLQLKDFYKKMEYIRLYFLEYTADSIDQDILSELYMDIISCENIQVKNDLLFHYRLRFFSNLDLAI